MDAVHHRAGLAGAVARGLVAGLHRHNAYDATDTALGFIGGIPCGADKLPRVAHFAHDPAAAEALGIETVPSQSLLSGFFAE